MTNNVERLNRIIEFIFRFGEKGLLRWCDENPLLVTEDLAQALHDQGILVVKENDFKTAKHLFYQSSIIWRKLGNNEKEIFEQIFYLDCRFQLTSDTDYYKIIADHARALLKEARAIENLDLAFCLATLEAECWWFAGKEAGQKETDICLKILNRLPRLPEVKAVRLRVWFERFISLSATVCDIYFKFSSDEKKTGLFTSKMKSLSEKIKIHTTNGFEFQLIPSDTSKIVYVLARLLVKFGDDDFAHYLLSQEARRCKSLGKIDDVIRSLGIRHVLALHSGNLTTKRKNEIKEDLVESLGSIRRSYRSRAGRIYNGGIMEQSLGDSLKELFNRGNNAEEVFSLAEYIKAPTLLERVKGHYITPTGEDTLKIYDLEQKMVYTKANITPEVLVVSKNDLALWRSETDKIMHDLEKLYIQSNSGFTKSVQTITISELQKCLLDGELIIEIIVPHNLMFPSGSVCLLAIDNQRYDLINLDKELGEIQKAWKSGMIGWFRVGDEQGIDVSPVNDLIFRTRLSILSGDEMKTNDCLTQLGKLVLQPLESAGFIPENYNCWHFVPSRAFHSIPFAALKDSNGKFLIERIAVTIAPSAAIFVHMSKKQEGKRLRAIAYGNPHFTNSGLPSLKNAEKEVRRISEIFSSVEWDVKIGIDATEEHFRKNAPGSHIIHIASHGLFSIENAIDSHSILLSPSSDHDGMLRADEIYNLNLGEVQLIVLSICNGSLYRFGPGDEPFGIIPALITSGAANIIGTLWPLEDAVGRQMMVDFYKALQEVNPAQALRKAACLLIEAKATVGQWASFTLCGSGRAR